MVAAKLSWGLTSRVSRGGSNFSMSTVNIFCPVNFFDFALFFAHVLNSGLSCIWKTIRALAGIFRANSGCLRMYLENSKPIVRCNSQNFTLFIFLASFYSTQILHSKKFPFNTQFLFRQSQGIIEVLNSHRKFINFPGWMNNILMRKSMAGIIADYRVPFISNQKFHLNNKFNYSVADSFVRMPNSCIFGIQKCKFFFADFHKGILAKIKGIFKNNIWNKGGSNV